MILLVFRFVHRLPLSTPAVSLLNPSHDTYLSI